MISRRTASMRRPSGPDKTVGQWVGCYLWARANQSYSEDLIQGAAITRSGILDSSIAGEDAWRCTNNDSRDEMLIAGQVDVRNDWLVTLRMYPDDCITSARIHYGSCQAMIDATRIRLCAATNSPNNYWVNKAWRSYAYFQETSNRNVRYYRNGSLIGSDTNTSIFSMKLDRVFNHATSSIPFKGYLADIRVYNHTQRDMDRYPTIEDLIQDIHNNPERDL